MSSRALSHRSRSWGSTTAAGGAYTATGVTLTLTAELPPGDANLDGVVDGSDLSVPSGSFGGSGGWTSGDFNGSGFIDGADLSILSGAFGLAILASALEASSTAPEPSAIALLTIGGLLAMWRRRYGIPPLATRNGRRRRYAEPNDAELNDAELCDPF